MQVIRLSCVGLGQIAAVAVVVAMAPTVGRSEKAVVLASVCGILDHRAGFVGKRVQFDAKVESDGIERTLLVDITNGCRGGIVPITSPGSTSGRVAGEEELDKAIFSGSPGTSDKEITARFVGRISLGDPEHFMFAPGRKIPILTIESVENLHVLPKPASR